jgi:CheY-like chemotaxis protein
MHPDTSLSAAQQTGTILVVDDEQFIREMLFEFLTESGYTVLAASNGMEALELFDREKKTIDLVITDLGMPEMGGEELYRRLRGINAAVKVVVSSGYLDGTTRENLLRMGIRQVLIKPFKMNDIQTAIRSALQSTL